jgi:hypothetical protein
MKDGTDWSPRIALFGDLGYVNAQSVPRLINDCKKEMYDKLVHITHKNAVSATVY